MVAAILRNRKKRKKKKETRFSADTFFWRHVFFVAEFFFWLEAGELKRL